MVADKMIRKKDYIFDKKKLHKIMLAALLIRLVMMLIVGSSGSWSESFLGMGDDHDDWRYLAGGMYFAEHASSLFDFSAFTEAYGQYGDWVGYNLNNPFGKAVLWYLIVCFVMYYTKTKWSVILLNIILAVWSIKYIYKFAELIYGEKTALLASKLYAFLPYPIVFCCFGYKEELVMFCTFYLLYVSAKFRYFSHLKRREWVALFTASIVLMGIRSGISLVLLMLCGVIMFYKNISSIMHPKTKIFLLTILATVLGGLLFLKFRGVIVHKLNAYLGVSNSSRESSIISLLMINGVTDIWKIPFSYMFSILMPFSLFSELTSWSSVISNLNVCMIPIAVGAALDIIFKRKTDSVVVWCCFAYYMIYVITSLNIFRQYASLLPLSLIAFSDYYSNSNRENKKMLIRISLLMLAIVVIFYGIRKF